MRKPISSGPPSPEEFQRQLQEFMRQHFQNAPGAAPRTEMSGAPDSPEAEPDEKEFFFDKTPREVKAYLDRFVIKQEEAKKVLSVALCDHYHHVRLAIEGKDQPNYAKQNVIFIGPTGVGKTYLIRSAADLIVAVDGKPVESTDEFLSDIESKAIGSVVELTIIRDGKQIKVPVTLGQSE